MAENKQQSQIELINTEINKELSSPEVSRALLATTFKGLTPVLMKQAIMEGMIRGYTFKDFLQRDVYALAFKNKDGLSYSLITSIDKARKIAQKAGQCGKKKPIYTYGEDGKIKTCEVTVQKKIGDYIGDYTAEVDFSEYNKNQNLWVSKPKTMIAKVAEMHALRSAFPEELSQTYIEDEMDQTPNILRMGEAETLVEETDLKMGRFKKDEKGEEGKNEDEVPNTGGEDNIPQ